MKYAFSSPGHYLCSLATVLEKNSSPCLMSFPFGMTRVFSLAEQSPADPQQAGPFLDPRHLLVLNFHLKVQLKLEFPLPRG